MSVSIFSTLLLIIISSNLSTFTVSPFNEGFPQISVFIVSLDSTDRCLDIIIQETFFLNYFLAQIHFISLFYIILSGSGGLIWNTLKLRPYSSGAKVEHSRGLGWHDLIFFTV